MRSRDAKIECTKFMRRYSGDPLYAGFASKRHDSSRIPRCSSCSSRGSLFLRSHRPQRVRSRTRISWGSRWPRAQRQRAMSMPLPGSCARAIEPKVMFARGPAFAPLTLHTQTDHDGQLVTDVTLSPDGRFVAFVTGLGFVEGQAHTPAGSHPCADDDGTARARRRRYGNRLDELRLHSWRIRTALCAGRRRSARLSLRARWLGEALQAAGFRRFADRVARDIGILRRATQAVTSSSPSIRARLTR